MKRGIKSDQVRDCRRFRFSHSRRYIACPQRRKTGIFARREQKKKNDKESLHLCCAKWVKRVRAIYESSSRHQSSHSHRGRLFLPVIFTIILVNECDSFVEATHTHTQRGRHAPTHTHTSHWPPKSNQKTYIGNRRQANMFTAHALRLRNHLYTQRSTIYIFYRTFTQV